MHTHTYAIKGYRRVTVNANGDWSGPTIINYAETGDELNTVEIPGELLIALSQATAIDFWRDKLIDTLESAELTFSIHSTPKSELLQAAQNYLTYVEINDDRLVSLATNEAADALRAAIYKATETD